MIFTCSLHYFHPGFTYSFAILSYLSPAWQLFTLIGGYPLADNRKNTRSLHRVCLRYYVPQNATLSNRRPTNNRLLTGGLQAGPLNTRAGMCWHMPAYASICRHIPAYATISLHMPAYAHIYMPTIASILLHIHMYIHMPSCAGICRHIQAYASTC